MRDNVTIGNQFGIFVRHARGVTVFHNLATRNCQGILVLDDGQKGGAGNVAILRNTAVSNNKFCPKTKDTPVNIKGGGILLLGATRHPGRPQCRFPQYRQPVQLRRDPSC